MILDDSFDGEKNLMPVHVIAGGCSEPGPKKKIKDHILDKETRMCSSHLTARVGEGNFKG